jgi:hypothetical protein
MAIFLPDSAIKAVIFADIGKLDESAKIDLVSAKAKERLFGFPPDAFEFGFIFRRENMDKIVFVHIFIGRNRF